jgi:hypothetical protein
MKSVSFIKTVVNFEELVKNFEVPVPQLSSKVNNRNGSDPIEGLNSLSRGSEPLYWPNIGSQHSQSKKSCREGGSDGEPRPIGQVDSISNLESLDRLSMTHVELNNELPSLSDCSDRQSKVDVGGKNKK